MDAIKEQFSYDDMDWALSKGAMCYACYFIASFPMVYWLDEPSVRNFLGHFFFISKRSFCQDRLGTNIGKLEKNFL
eukprot:COSAG06_NODE_250_length_19080_cov_6.483029_15_plen_76_part_00